MERSDLPQDLPFPSDADTAQLSAEALRRTLDRLIEGCQVIGRDYRYLYVNDAVTVQGRKPRAELLGRTMSEAYPGIEATPVYGLIARVRDTGESAELENEFEFADGTRRWFELRIEAVPEGVFILSIDITDRLTTQRLQNRSQRLESLGTLAAGVAHDLNNSLAPLLLSVGMLRDEQRGAPELLDAIEDGAERSVRLVRQLLTFAKGADGRRIPVAPARLVGEMERMIRRTFPKTINASFAAVEALPHVLADATQLHQVLLNLCVNARDAMPGGGTLVVEAGQLDVDETYASSIVGGRVGRFVTFTVRDSGPGIAEDVLERIFEPFFTTKGAAGGTGLGLSTSLGIIRGHGGFLHVYTELGRGTTFRAFVPTADPGASEPFASPITGIDGADRSVLVIDDDARLRQTATTVLSQLGFRVLTAVDGADALRHAAAHQRAIDLVRLDLQMPTMGGEELYGRLREILPSTPVIVATGRVVKSDRDPRMEHLPFLQKPFTLSDLVATLRVALAEPD
jgi:PAS domain S-box-containing protein